MSSFYKRKLKDREVWYVNLLLPDGRRKSINTQCESKAAAKQVAAEFERKILLGLDPTQEVVSAGSLPELIAAFLAERKPFWSPKTLYAYKDALERLRRSWGHAIPLRVTSTHVHDFLASLGSISPASVNHYISHVAAFLHWCHEKGHLRSVAKIKRIRQPGQAQRDYYTVDECSALLAAAEGRTINGVSFRSFLFLLMTTGLRVGEATELRWEWIDTQRGLIRLPPSVTKSNRKRAVPISADLIQTLPRTPDKVFPFSSESGHLRKVWRAVTKAAGVRYLKLHNLRDTAAVQMILSGTPLPVVSRILGHASVTTTMSHYADLTGEEVPEATAAFSTALLRESRKLLEDKE